ncbi:MAG: B12-binding domain-containing radical SAM protein [Nitrospirae bacterium]|nr:B12-binding domain-containing radical SAM protein [Nitrospirota bacterium]
MSRILFVAHIDRTMLLSGGFVTFGPMWLSAVMKQHGHQCEIAGVNYKEVEKTFEEFKPDIVAYTAFSGGHKTFLAWNMELKKKFNFFAMFGGPHPTFSPEMVEEEGVDGVCKGEGFEAMPELVNKLMRGENITNVKNWWVKVDGKIYRNDQRPLIKDLDVLPPPDRSLYNRYKDYRLARTATVMTSQGCPFNCTYCHNHLLHKMRLKGDPVFRQRSVDHVINELKELKRDYPKIEYLIFRDEILTLNKNWIQEFSEKYPKEIGIPFYCLMRPEIIREDVIDDLIKSGMYYIGIGIESGNDFIRNTVLNRKMTKKQIVDGLKILRDKNVKFSLYNIVGAPHETLETAMETWELTVKCKPTFCDAFLLTPYPKTDIYDYSVANGFFDPNIQYPETYHERIILNLKDRRQLENFMHLLGVAVEFPSLMPLIKNVLIKLPLRPLYNRVRKFWKGYVYRYRIYPYKVSAIESVRIIYNELFVSKV